MTRIAHISDIHFGRISNPTVVDTLVSEINRAGVDLVVVSGDLTQRAFGHQFRAARRMLDAFDAPTLVVPGNHDVFPWWRLFSRLFDPLRRYKKLITPDLAPRVSLPDEKTSPPDVVVQGINSAFGWTVQGGRITAAELSQIGSGFANVHPHSFRILVVHHHIAQLKAIGDHDMCRGAAEALTLAKEMNVDLVLSGHLHISHVVQDSESTDGTPLVVASSGTSTSSRGRGPDPLGNYFNLIQISDDSFEVEERRLDAEKAQFKRFNVSVFKRRRGQ